MATDAFTTLEQKIEELLNSLGELRADNEKLRQDVADKQEKIQELQTQNTELSTSFGSLQGDSEGNQEKLDAAADKLSGLIARLESVE